MTECRDAAPPPARTPLLLAAGLALLLVAGWTGASSAQPAATAVPASAAPANAAPAMAVPPSPAGVAAAAGPRAGVGNGGEAGGAEADAAAADGVEGSRSGSPTLSATDPGLDWRPLGLLRIRDLTPFGILRLDMLPAHAVTAAPGTFGIEANLSYQNTYVLSRNVEQYLEDRGPGRASLSAEDIDAILALPGDAYFVDGEFGLLDLTLHYWASERWSAYVTLPYLYFDGGFLDDTIEDFHENFGFSPASRDRVIQDRFQVVARIDGTTVVMPRAPDSGFGDPVVGLRWSRTPRPDGWNLVLEGAAKIPVRGRERILTTGKADFGLQATLQRFFASGAFHLSLAGVYYAPPSTLPNSESVIPTVVVGWEQRLSRRSSAILQLYASPSVVQDSSAEELTEDKYQLTLGFQTWRGRTAWRFGITENVSNFSNTPDIGVTLQVARAFGGRLRR